MKKTILSLLLVAVLVSVLTVAASADDGLVYGTMNIPFADFYSAEGVNYTVDAVSSATNSKWFSDSLATGGYSVKHENDEGGDILGITYPVAISAQDLDTLGAENYGFTALEEAPAAYKLVTLNNGVASFSAVQGETAAWEAAAELTTRTVWGDYEIDIDAIHNSDGSSDIGPILGAFLTTEDGAVYAMRQLENIWRDELSWSSGITTEEPHGNIMSAENFTDLMGKNIVSITYITDSGYHVISTALYVPVKFVGGAAVESVEAAAGAAAISFENLPEDYSPSYTVNGLTFSVTDGRLLWENALAGAYTLTVSDENGKYADLDAAFVLSTDALPVVYDVEENMLVAAEGFSDEEAAAFLKNLASVSVNGTEYAASGRGAVAIIDVDGEVDTEAELVSGRGANATHTPIFPESGDYSLIVTATGYTQPLAFTVSVK